MGETVYNVYRAAIPILSSPCWECMGVLLCVMGEIMSLRKLVNTGEVTAVGKGFANSSSFLILESITFVILPKAGVD